MKISTIKLIIFYTIIFNFFFTKIFSQTIEQTTKFADSLYVSKNYKFALKEYERIIFFENNNSEIYKKIAQIYFLQKDYSTAIQNYNLALNNEQYIENQIELKFQIINCKIQTSKYESAIIDLFSLSDSISYENKQRQNFYLGICFFDLEKYSSSEKYFILCLDSNNVVAKEELKKIFLRTKKFKNPNPRIASILSLIPGLGQIYAGEYLKAINSLLLTSAIIFISYRITVNYKFIDAFISMFPLLERYYLGGAKSAYNLAVTNRKLKKDKVYNQILELILKFNMS